MIGRVVPLNAQQTQPLRSTVLRNGPADGQVPLDEDDWPGVMHLGVADDEGRVIGTSTWIPRPFAPEPETPAFQLRGMATARTHQGSGVGGRLLEAGCTRVQAAGAELVWANARDSALAFYERHGFVAVGVGFVDQATQLPHHVVVRRLV